MPATAAFWAATRRHAASMVPPVARCLEAVKERDHRRGPVILMTPQGRPFHQTIARELAAKHERLILLCGHYEGVDERIRALVDDEISIGDYVLTGGELPAMVVTDAVARLIPGVLGHEDSPHDESFSHGLLEYPQYTRPREFQGMTVPDILYSGHHAEIQKWRREQALKRTRERRPDLKPEEIEEAIPEIEAKTKDMLYKNGIWHINYRRIQVAGVKR